MNRSARTRLSANSPLKQEIVYSSPAIIYEHRRTEPAMLRISDNICIQTHLANSFELQRIKLHNIKGKSIDKPKDKGQTTFRKLVILGLARLMKARPSVSLHK